MLRLGEVGELVVGQRREAAVAVAAVQAVVDVLDDVWARGVGGASPVLLLFAAAGRRAAEVQRGGRGGHGVDRREGGGQGVRADEKLAVGVTSQGGAVILGWKFSPWKAFRDKSWQHREGKCQVDCH